MSHGNTVDDEHCFLSSDEWSVREDHPDFRGHAMSMCLDFKGSWKEHFLLVEFAYNNNYEASIQMAPYEALYQRLCRSPVCWTEVEERPSTGPDLVRDIFEKVDLIWKCLLKAQSWQKSYVDKRRQPLEFEVGDHVFLNVMLRKK